MADPKKGLWEGQNFKGIPQFLKSNRISLAYGLTKLLFCLVFLLYRGICRFCAIFRHFGGMAALDPHGFPPPVKTYMCTYLENLKTISAQIITKKCMRILPCKGKSYHRFKYNVSESESRQFDQLV